jgi:UDP-N-acetylglucosamine 4,6-dehydratase
MYKKTKAAITKELKNKTILVTGGAGSVGSVLIKKILEFPVKSIRVLDIDEHALFRLNRAVNDKRLRLLLGSITDKDRVEMAGHHVDIVLHLAAIKNIEISEFNPIETIDTNVLGMINLLKMLMRNKPKKFLNVSTDKAVESTTLYGTTKQIGERLTSWAGNHIEYTKFATIRLGNVMETRGNVFEIWEEERKKNKPLSVTHPKMERYFFHVDEAVDNILKCIPLTNVGEIFVTKMKSFKIKDLASEISKKQKIIGLRQGEKLEEILITEEEKKKAQEKNNMWIIRQYQ